MLGRRNLEPYPIAVCVLMLIQASCTKTPESYPLASKPGNYPLSSLRVDYQTKDALAVALEQRSDNHVAHLNAETEAVQQKARTLKKCSA